MLIDWHLPEGDGWQLAKTLKEARPQLHVFIYTGDKPPLFMPSGLYWFDKIQLQDWPRWISNVCRTSRACP